MHLTILTLFLVCRFLSIGRLGWSQQRSGHTSCKETVLFVQDTVVCKQRRKYLMLVFFSPFFSWFVNRSLVGHNSGADRDAAGKHQLGLLLRALSMFVYK